MQKSKGSSPILGETTYSNPASTNAEIKNGRKMVMMKRPNIINGPDAARMAIAMAGYLLKRP